LWRIIPEKGMCGEFIRTLAEKKLLLAASFKLFRNLLCALEDLWVKQKRAREASLTRVACNFWVKKTGTNI
jgi:hypothetical protein